MIKALLQFTIIPGDISKNTATILTQIQSAKEKGAAICISPELGLCGYPNLQHIHTIGEHCEAALMYLAKKFYSGPILILGAIQNTTDGLYNAAFLLSEGKVQCICRKRFFIHQQSSVKHISLFSSGEGLSLVTINDEQLLISIGRDVLHGISFSELPNNPKLLESENISILKNSLAKTILCLCSEPIITSTIENLFQGISIVAHHIKKDVYFINHVGEHEHYLYAGGSYSVDAKGNILSQPKFFEEKPIIVTCDNLPIKHRMVSLDPTLIVWKTLVFGIQTYCKKYAFSDVVLGISGGIDSALVLALAVEALGPKHVHGILMPSPWSSEESIADAMLLAGNLKVQTTTIPISSLMETFNSSLSQMFQGYPIDTTEENIQSRIRGVILMALSNKFQWMVLSTGNKSERAVGYCTLYGDTCGALAPIGDVYKTDVYRLAYWYNQYKQKESIPYQILTKAPSAELRPDQKDQDTLPPYETLDYILNVLLENNISFIDTSYPDQSLVDSIKKLMFKNAFKYKQSPPALIISHLPLYEWSF